MNSAKKAAGLRSMTGFARVRQTVLGFDVVVSVKSVNHRGLDLHFHTGPDTDPFENSMRSAIKQKVSRGHIDIRVSIARSGETGTVGVDEGKVAAYVAELRRGAQQYGLTCEPDLNSAFRIPGFLSDSAALELPEGFEAGLIDALHDALDQMNHFREREGAELAAVLLQRNAAVSAAAEKIEKLRDTALEYFHARLKERLAELLNGVAIEPQRLAQEAALLADRTDIGEEIARLKIHSRQLDEIVRGECEIGKKLDFLLQEMNRETNTILSKTSGIGAAGLEITDLALLAKSEIEKIREQALNLE